MLQLFSVKEVCKAKDGLKSSETMSVAAFGYYKRLRKRIVTSNLWGLGQNNHSTTSSHWNSRLQNIESPEIYSCNFLFPFRVYYILGHKKWQMINMIVLCFSPALLVLRLFLTISVCLRQDSWHHKMWRNIFRKDCARTNIKNFKLN